MRLVSVSVTTAADGTASVDTPVMNGFLEKVVVDEGTWSNAAADVTIKDKVTGETLLTITNADGIVGYPLRDVQATDAGAAIAAAAGENIRTRFPVAGKLNIAVAQGGNALTGKVHFFVDDGAAYIK